MRFAPLPIVQQPIKRLLSLSRTKRRTLNYMLAMHTSQEFNINILYQAISIDKPIDRQIFLFYRQELEKTIIPFTNGAYHLLFRPFNSLGRYTFLRQQLAKIIYAQDFYRIFLCKLVKDEFIFGYR
ncbi:unnamed protein product [Rotaria sordida]|uniref:Uncharacterized protein n=1 Tax=Rotaria sordida TaxID=392033 RepID=A0A815BK53_9BILA|nr:unnamed protein product [Rotaria sordida]CAF1549926.1 unnamed protein product [Rotaria sordida]